MSEHRLARLHREEAVSRAQDGVVVVPVGSLEQHGQHIPIGCDSMLVEAMCLAAAGRTSRDVLVAPALWTGYSLHHMRFGATATLGLETFLAVVRDICTSLRTWAPTVAVVNGHGGNRGPLISLALELDLAQANYFELAPEAIARCTTDHGSPGHAGQFETSLMLAVEPGLIGTPGSDFVPVSTDNVALLALDLGTSGVIGDPDAASLGLGEMLYEQMAGALAAWLDGVPAGRTSVG